ncbi:MAG: serine hydrolase domain-containing protein [Pseudomonadota bacterium]
MTCFKGLASVLTGTLVAITATVKADEAYTPTTSVAESRAMVAALPEADIWWTVPGDPMRWYNLNLPKIVPTATIYRDGPVRPLATAPNPAIGAFEVETPHGPMPFDAFLDSDQSTTMAVLILHEGKIAFERYPRQQPHDKPLFWSVTKALVATVLAILEDRGEVDVSQPVDHYLPALKDSAYAGVAVRDVLDMASGIDCADDYEDQQSCYYRYSSSIGEGFRPPNSPDNPYDYIASLGPEQRWAEAGTGYSYSGVDTFVVGWLVEELTGMPFQDAFSDEVWRHLGAEGDALIWAGRYGIPLTSGGFMSSVRDMGRFGLLFTPSRSVVTDRNIISDRYLKLIQEGGRPELRRRARGGDISNDDVLHNVYQWDAVYASGAFMKGGWAGQGLMIHPQKDLVAVWTGYFDEDWGQVSVEPMIRQLWAALYPAPAD